MNESSIIRITAYLLNFGKNRNQTIYGIVIAICFGSHTYIQSGVAFAIQVDSEISHLQ